MQFYIDFKINKKENVKISGDDAKHIIKSLRMKPGEMLLLVDSAGWRYESSILDFQSGVVVCSIVKSEPPSVDEHSGKLILVQSLISNSSMKSVIQKAVEMGVDVILPVLAERSNARHSDATDPARAKRWKKVMYEAWKQSETGKWTELADVVKLSRFVADCSVDALNIYLAERFAGVETKIEFKKQGDIFFVIGPEGGFTESEVFMFKEKKILPLSLGNTILRSETASVAAIAVVSHMRRQSS